MFKSNVGFVTLLQKETVIEKTRNPSIWHISVNLLQIASAFCYLPALKVGEGKENASRMVFCGKFMVAVGLERVHRLPCL